GDQGDPGPRRGVLGSVHPIPRLGLLDGHALHGVRWKWAYLPVAGFGVPHRPSSDSARRRTDAGKCRAGDPRGPSLRCGRGGRRGKRPPRQEPQEKGPLHCRGETSAARDSAMMLPDAAGHFGEYGGRFVPETLIPALEELESAWRSARTDPTFQAELTELLQSFAGRPTPISRARRMSDDCGAD